MIGSCEASGARDRQGSSEIRVSALFGEPNLIADAGLLPLVVLAERVGLPDLAATVRIEAADNTGGAARPPR
ncbi:hypothetical protein Snoj_01040 [Streptomyces nojiriensis]|uniref:Uncharacterized protein n=1 Tax=Streptomyces nojiriensis TaxID=66374 RepID=A0ABQ3SDH2_9ACTN|nr:hypothetical protein GCM10010205_75750 [Streptomyces nojiriensis]GHI66186.1 hypothetical protein Snoj_01040 [Streptomyces nojiriensis]